MIIRSYCTCLDISGYEYPVVVKYTKNVEGIDILDILIRNDDEEMVEFPYLGAVDMLIHDQIEEYESYGLD